VSAGDRPALDLETLDALERRPDLIAIADAVAATQRRRRRRVPAARPAAAAAAVVAAAAVALVVPWPGRGAPFAARALAALGDGQVIHVVSVSDADGQSVVDLASGVARPVEIRTEIWFDSSRALERTVSSFDGRVTQEELQTPQGSWTQAGPVYTCAWIAAHPVEATKARVSCNANGDNGTTPHTIPEPTPTLDPALAGFVGGYRDALANGTAQRDGSGTVEGRPVEWLRFAGAGLVERVAVDTQTLKPVLVERLVDGQPLGETRIATIETVDPGTVDFSRPQPAPADPAAAEVTGQETTTPAAAAAAVDGRLLWAGEAVDGLPLATTTVQQITTGFGADSGIPYRHSQGVQLTYGGAAADTVVLKESTQPELLYGFAAPGRTAPAEGEMLVSTVTALPSGASTWSGLLQHDGVYVTVQATSRTLLLDAARGLAFYGSAR
jgi:hypothetical protein